MYVGSVQYSAFDTLFGDKTRMKGLFCLSLWLVPSWCWYSSPDVEAKSGTASRRFSRVRTLELEVPSEMGIGGTNNGHVLETC